MGERESAHATYLALIVAFFNAVLARKRAAAIASLIIGYAASVWPWLIGQSGRPSAAFALGLAAGLIFLLSAAELIRSRSQRAAALQRTRDEEFRRRASEEVTSWRLSLKLSPEQTAQTSRPARPQAP